MWLIVCCNLIPMWYPSKYLPTSDPTSSPRVTRQFDRNWRRNRGKKEIKKVNFWQIPRPKRTLSYQRANFGSSWQWEMTTLLCSSYKYEKTWIDFTSMLSHCVKLTVRVRLLTVAFSLLRFLSPRLWGGNVYRSCCGFLFDQSISLNQVSKLAIITN